MIAPIMSIQRRIEMSSLRRLAVLAGLSVLSTLATAADLSFRADNVASLPDGSTRFSGNVVLTFADSSSRFHANKITSTSATEFVLEGDVRFEIGNRVIKTARAVVTKSERLVAKMDDAVATSR